MEGLLIIAGMIAIVIAIVAISYWMDKKRREALQQTATELGLDFFPDGSETLQAELSAFKLFNSGRAKKLTKLIKGESDEVQISIFDYQYTTGSGKNSHTHSQTVAAMQSPTLRICEFSMRPENMLDRLGSMIGMDDIDFDSHPNFSKWFLLKGANESAVRQLFKPAVLSYFEGKKGISVEGQSAQIIIFRPGKKTKPNEVKNFLAEAYEVYGIFVDNLSMASSED